MKTFFAFLLLLITIAIICYPLYVVWFRVREDSRSGMTFSESLAEKV